VAGQIKKAGNQIGFLLFSTVAIFILTLPRQSLINDDPAARCPGLCTMKISTIKASQKSVKPFYMEMHT